MTTEPPGKPLDLSAGLQFSSSNTCCVPGTLGGGWGGRLGQTEASALLGLDASDFASEPLSTTQETVQKNLTQFSGGIK